MECEVGTETQTPRSRVLKGWRAGSHDKESRVEGTLVGPGRGGGGPDTRTVETAGSETRPPPGTVSPPTRLLPYDRDSTPHKPLGVRGWSLGRHEIRPHPSRKTFPHRTPKLVKKLQTNTLSRGFTKREVDRVVDEDSPKRFGKPWFLRCSTPYPPSPTPIPPTRRLPRPLPGGSG